MDNRGIFRIWFYFRTGWSTYFAFILAAINTLTVTYFLAIDNYPSLKNIFPSFEIYILIVSIIGIPILTAIGYSHFKRTPGLRSESGSVCPTVFRLILGRIWQPTSGDAAILAQAVRSRAANEGRFVMSIEGCARSSAQQAPTRTS